MVTHLAQLHLNIHELGQVTALDGLHEESVVVFEDGAVVLLLGVGELDVDEGLFLGGDVLGDVYRVKGEGEGEGEGLVGRVRLEEWWE